MDCHDRANGGETPSRWLLVQEAGAGSVGLLYISGISRWFCGVPTFDRIKSSGLGREAEKVDTARRRRLGARP